MNAAADIFESHRSRLFAIAYRMLGSRADAQDLVQDVYLRWHRSTAQHIDSPLAFLVTIARRLCLDRLRELKRHRTESVDLSSIEPGAEEHAPSPEAQLEFNGEVSAGFLAVLERLSPAERAVFLLHDVFDYDYPEVAQTLRKSEQSCRQTVHRARAHLREPRARFSVTPESRERALTGFLMAAGTGDRRAIASLVASA
jgi:RNA polymerase sigma-70 factor (ECF subfamily)